MVGRAVSVFIIYQVGNDMSKNKDDDKHKQETLSAVSTEWGKEDKDHFGYASDEERRAKRGMEDWELVNTIPESQKGVPLWFVAVVVVVLLVAIGLSLPFWGDREGYEREWFDWGFGGAIIYVAVMSVFVYFMVNLYGSNIGGRLDQDKLKEEDKSVESNEKSKSHNGD